MLEITFYLLYYVTLHFSKKNLYSIFVLKKYLNCLLWRFVNIMLIAQEIRFLDTAEKFFNTLVFNFL